MQIYNYLQTKNPYFKPEDILEFYRERVEFVTLSLENYNNAAMKKMTKKLNETIANKKIEVDQAENKCIEYGYVCYLIYKYQIYKSWLTTKKNYV